MKRLLEDIRAKIGVVEIFEKTTKIHINGIPFVPVKQEMLDDFRKKGIYEKYLLAIKTKTTEEVDRVVTERKTKVDIAEICGGGEMADNW